MNIEQEYNYWVNNVINKWIIINCKCPNCQNDGLRIHKSNKSLSNPVKLRCNDRKNKKSVNIRNDTFFAFFKKVPISIVIKVIELFLLENKNAKEIETKIKDIYQLNSFNNKIIYKIILLIRKSISHYLKEIYYDKMTDINQHANIAFDESLFCHFNGNQQIWLIGLINTQTQDFKIEAVYGRKSDILEKIIKFHVSKGNNIITDGWPGYNWMNDSSCGYHRIIHIHGQNDFGHGSETTPYIERVWGDLKRLLSKIYVSVKSDNFIYFEKNANIEKLIICIYFRPYF